MRSTSPKRTVICLALAVLGFGNIGWAQTQRTMQAPPVQRTASRQFDGGRTVTANATEVQGNYLAQPRSRVAPASYVPQHQRVAQMTAEPIAAQPMSAPVVGGPSMGSCATCNSGVGTSYFAAESVMSCDSCGDVGCNSCMSMCDRGGCPPELIGDCWIGALGGILYKAEYFAGAQGFTSPAYTIPGRNDLTKDCSFGFNAGINAGIPLCRLTCGLLSGQAGVRTVNSEFSGTPFTSDNRDQLFVTTGLYRRVDYGFQFGVVADFLFENWYTDTTTVQIRGDIGWVYAGGNTIGFRFAEGVQDDVSNGTFNGTAFNSIVTSTFDQSRFYYRQNCSWGGYSDIFLGWSDEKHVIGGLEYDIPMGECWALQSSFTYFMPENDAELTASGGNANEAWNIGVGFVWRPQGRCWYDNYDRPILPVADNGTMVLRRRF
ncbi:MAG: DUF6666 family protein [Pirellulaceae bacterium]